MAENYVLLETIELTQSAASVTFDNIPQSGYTDLKVVASVRVSPASNFEGIRVRFNSDSGFNYADRTVYGNGSSAASIFNTFGDDTSFTWVYVNADASTASTYGNLEMYVPNYTSANQKSVSFDSVTENNATTAAAFLNAGLWNQTSAITSISFIARSGTILANSTFSLYGVAAVGTTPVTAPKATGGNIVANDGTYWYHAFLTSGFFTPQTALTCDALVVAGGGGGSGWDYAGGGGGAGGLLAHTSQSLTAINYTVTVGAGGAGNSVNNTPGTDGSNSQFSSLTAAVGGGGGGGSNNANSVGRPGGSGGGAGVGGSNGGAGTSGQGNNGGVGFGGEKYTGGGGGGKGAVGGNGTSTTGGAGGVGVNTYSTWATATSTGVGGYFAGGGGGGVYAQYGGGASGGAGGSGGGGTGGVGNGSTASVAGTANTGGGGGGNGSGTNGSAGGSGIVIIRYAMV